MSNKKNRNGVYLMILSIFAFTLVISMSMMDKNTDDMAEVVRNDIEPIEKRFAILKDGIEDCYWTSGTYGVSSIGPSDIWLKGIIFLEDDLADNIFNDYNFSRSKIVMDIDKFINEKDFMLFEWYKSEEFIKDVMEGQDYIKEIYFDPNNKIIYFDLSTY